MANGVNAQTNKIEITIVLEDASWNLKKIIEGDLAAGIPVPPMQEVLNQVRIVSTGWEELVALIQETMYGTIDAITVRNVAALTRGIVDQMYLACDAYVTAATLANPNLRTTIIIIAGRQRMLLQKMTKEAALIYFGKYVACDATEVKGNE